ncbi:hypothetical protein DRN87_04040 [Candidatus Geothermarchaeota archaeon]|nr:MAG: hypothetical protein DRN87_04040 [Candidatus Geothermarchaeota archaeon]HEW93278.1 M20 family peptidase [Thermoprotei archaeon]
MLNLIYRLERKYYTLVVYLTDLNNIFKLIDNSRNNIIDLLLKLIRFDTSNPPGYTTEIVEYIREFYDGIGFRSRIIEGFRGKPNLIVDNNIDGDTLFIYNGHMDVVPATSIDKWVCEPFKGCISEGFVYGRGAADMKSSLATIMYASKAIVESGYSFKRRIEFHFVADEEVGGLYGTKYLVEKGFVKGRYGLVGEGSVRNNVIYIRPAVRGGVWVKIKSYGRPGHASNPKSGVNAVLNMARVLDYIDREFKLDKLYSHQILPPPSISPGTMIKGGVKENVIPDYCESTSDIRIVPGMGPDTVLNHINSLISELKMVYPEINTELELVKSIAPAEIPLDSPIIKLVSNAVYEVSGYKPDFLGGTGCNDATYLINDAGVEAISGFGPGDGALGNMHGINERVSIDILVKFTKIYASTLIKVDSLDG